MKETEDSEYGEVNRREIIMDIEFENFKNFVCDLESAVETKKNNLGEEYLNF